MWFKKKKHQNPQFSSLSSEDDSKIVNSASSVCWSLLMPPRDFLGMKFTPQSLPGSSWLFEPSSQPFPTCSCYSWATYFLQMVVNPFPLICKEICINSSMGSLFSSNNIPPMSFSPILRHCLIRYSMLLRCQCQDGLWTGSLSSWLSPIFSLRKWQQPSSLWLLFAEFWLKALYELSYITVTSALTVVTLFPTEGFVRVSQWGHLFGPSG